jgi:hypothetical protein
MGCCGGDVFERVYVKVQMGVFAEKCNRVLFSYSYMFYVLFCCGARILCFHLGMLDARFERSGCRIGGSCI